MIGETVSAGDALPPSPYKVAITDEVRETIMELADELDSAVGQERIVSRARLEAYIYKLQSPPPHPHLELLLRGFM